MKQIGIFGSAFNPPTKGHFNAVSQAIASFDQIILVPTFIHPFHKNMLPFEIRIQMLELVLYKFKELSPSITYSKIEKTIYKKTKAPIYTYHLLEELELLYNQKEKTASLSFIIGPDNIKRWKTFYKYQEIEKKWNLFSVSENVSIRSSLVRNLIQNHNLNKKKLLELLLQYVELSLAKFIISNKLYT